MNFLVIVSLLMGMSMAQANEQNIEGSAYLMLFCPVCMIPEALREKDDLSEEEVNHQPSEEIEQLKYDQ